jgi:hypothetical protein
MLQFEECSCNAYKMAARVDSAQSLLLFVFDPFFETVIKPSLGVSKVLHCDMSTVVECVHQHRFSGI